jgi:hypothetical protein
MVARSRGHLAGIANVGIGDAVCLLSAAVLLGSRNMVATTGGIDDEVKACRLDMNYTGSGHEHCQGWQVKTAFGKVRNVVYCEGKCL